MSLWNSLMEKRPPAHNLPPKLFSFVIALVLWIYVMDVENPEMIKVIKNVEVVPVSVEKLADRNLVLSSAQFPSVDVTVKGRRSDVSEVDKQDIRLSVDVGNLKYGTQEVSIDKMLNLENISISAMSRRTVDLDIDKQTEQLKPVEIVFKGNAPNGLVPDSAVPVPSIVMVQGPAKRVKQVAKVVGEVDAASLSVKTEAQIPVTAVNSKGTEVTGVRLQTKTVKATLGLSQMKSVPVSPTLTGTIPAGYELVDIQIKPSLLTLKGPEDTLKLITTLKTRPISLGNLTTSVQVPVTIDLPKGVALSDSEMAVVASIRVEAVKTVEFTYGGDEVQFFNVEKGTTARLPSGLKVHIRGIGSLVDGIRKSDIKPRIDVQNQAAGNGPGLVSYTVSPQYERLQIEPSRVELLIQ